MKTYFLLLSLAVCSLQQSAAQSGKAGQAHQQCTGPQPQRRCAGAPAQGGGRVEVSH